MIDIDGLLARGEGLILARHHRRLKSSLSRWVQQGRLVRLMRGVYAHPRRAARDRLAAVKAIIPGGVIAGEAALTIAFHLDRPLGVIEVCTPTRRRPQVGYRFTHRLIPREYVSHGVMAPTLVAVDLADRDPSWLDELVRQRLAIPEHFAQALREFPHRVGNPIRRRRIDRTRSRPWSVAERAYHDLFDAHKIIGWVANKRVTIGEATYAPDIAFEAEKLAIEIDSVKFHADRGAFEADRRRHDELVRAGWVVLHFTWAMLSDPDWIIDSVRDVRSRLRRSRRRSGGGGRLASRQGSVTRTLRVRKPADPRT